MEKTPYRTPTGAADAIVADNVRQLRHRQGLSVQVLADRIKAEGGAINRVAIAKIEVHSRRVTVDDLLDLARALGVEPTYLLTDAPVCDVCQNQPPAGFKCRICGSTA